MSLSDTTSSRRLVSIPKSEIPENTATTVVVGYRKIAVINDGGRYYALLNSCPHHQAPLSAGRVAGSNGPTPAFEFSYSSERRVLRCPWHHYEYDMTTGECLADPKRFRVATYEVQEEGDEIVIMLPARS